MSRFFECEALGLGTICLVDGALAGAIPMLLAIGLDMDIGSREVLLRPAGSSEGTEPDILMAFFAGIVRDPKEFANCESRAVSDWELEDLSTLSCPALVI